MTSDLIATLTAEAFAEVPDTIGGRAVVWRVRRLLPGDAARCGLLEGLLGAPVAKMVAGATQGKPVSLQAGADFTADLLPGLLAGAEAAVALAVVAVRSAPAEGEPAEEWQPVRLVKDFDGTPGTVPLSAISGGALAAVAWEALRRAVEAGQTAVTFLGRPAGASVAG